ncbi:MAG: hypothetical protein HOP29_13245, partial [Phycisphaerales bacterium]|nr:hypothetical protein [Phycisphaerales bacterium]
MQEIMERRQKTESESGRHAGEGSSALREAKETTESIVIAFILAFVFRAFIVEAFVIPTGSMAATLYGQHGTLICEDCGWENAYGLNGDEERAGRYGPDSRVLCQNCGHYNTNLKFHDGMRSGDRRLLGGNAESGDRILVFKWPFDVGAGRLGPERWDVTVFKNPANGDENFIKRLVGLPGEVLEILDGDVYAAPASELTENTLRTMGEFLHLKYRMRTSHVPNDDPEWARLRDPMEAVLAELANKLHIVRKSPAAQNPLWNVVYHHDYPPRELGDGQPFWNPDRGEGSRWSTGDRCLRFSGATGGEGVVRYAGKAIVDHNSYNIDVPSSAWNPVSDLRLETVVYPGAGDGWVELDLCKGEECFAARLDAQGRLTLTGHGESGTTESGEVMGDTMVSPMGVGRPFELALEILDYRAAVIVDRQEVLATTLAQFAPDIRTLRERDPTPSRAPFIAAGGVDVELRHVVLYRDAYYTAPYMRG